MGCGFDLSLNNAKIEPPLQRTLTFVFTIAKFTIHFFSVYEDDFGVFRTHKKPDMQVQGFLFKVGATFKVCDVEALVF